MLYRFLHNETSYHLNHQVVQMKKYLKLSSWIWLIKKNRRSSQFQTKQLGKELEDYLDKFKLVSQSIMPLTEA